MDQRTDELIRPAAFDPARPEAPQKASPTTRPKRPWWLLIVLIAIAAGVYYYKMKGQQAPQPQHAATNANANAAQPVGVDTIVTGDIPITYDALGTVTSLQTVTIISQIAGYIQSVNFKEGQYVKAGDLIAQIDPRPSEISLQQFEGQLAHDQAALDQAKMDLVRFQGLVQKDSIVKQTADDQAFIVKQDEGTVRVDQAQIDAQKLNLIYCRITSPVTGRIGLRLVDPGNYVQPSNTTGIAVATQTDPISVIFPVPEDLLPSIQDQMRAGHELSAVAYDRSNTQELATGKLYALDSTINTSTGTVNLRASFPNPDNKLFPNQFVNLRLLINTLKHVTVAPNAAIQHGAPGTYVFLVQGDKVAVRNITVGQIEGDKAQITSGLAAGDQVVVDGIDRLRDGAPIRIPNTAANNSNPPNGSTRSPSNGDKAAGQKKPPANDP